MARYELYDESEKLFGHDDLYEFIRAVEAFVDENDKTDEHGDSFEMFAGGGHQFRVESSGGTDFYDVISMYDAVYWCGVVRGDNDLMKFYGDGNQDCLQDLYTTEELESSRHAFEHVLEAEWGEMPEEYRDCFENPHVLLYPELQDDLRAILEDMDSDGVSRFPGITAEVSPAVEGAMIWWKGGATVDEMKAFLLEYGHTLMRGWNGNNDSFYGFVGLKDINRPRSIFTTFMVHQGASGREYILYHGASPINLQEAHWKSLAGWEFRYEHPMAEINAGDACGYCNLYLHGDVICGGCPIASIGHPQCHGTPYKVWDSIVRFCVLRDMPESQEYGIQSPHVELVRKAITAEIAFLKQIAEKNNLIV